MLRNLSARYHFTCGANQMSEQQKFLRREIEWHAGACGLMPSHVHFQISDAQMFCLFLRSTAQYGAHPGEQFRKCERVDQIIVCTQLKSFHTVAHTVASGKKENRCTDPVVAELCDHFPTVLVWQHDVDDQKIKFLCERLLQTSLAIACNIDRKTGFTESFGQESRRFLF